MKYINKVIGVLIVFVFFCSCGEKTYEYQSGVYHGEWSSGAPEGYGRYISSEDSLVYEGNWQKGC